MDKKLAQLSALQETTRAMVSTLELDELLDLIIQQAVTLLHADGGVLNLADWSQWEDEVYACTGSLGGFLGMRSSLDGSLSGWVTIHNQPVISNQIQQDPRVDRQAASLIGQLKNAAVAPLAIKEQVTGSLVLVDKGGGQVDFEQDDLDLLASFAHQAASVLENARLYAAEKRRSEQFRALAEVSRRLTLIVDEGEVYRQVVNIIQQIFSYDHVAIGRIEGDEVVSIAQAGANAGKSASYRVRLGQGVWGWVAQSGEAYSSSDIEDDLRFKAGPPETAGVAETAGPPETAGAVRGLHAYLCVPLKSNDGISGVLSAASFRPNAFDESDLVLLQTLARQTVVVVQNIRYYDRAQRVAVMEERSRLARELHDAVTQSLFSSSMLAEALPEIWENDAEEGRRVLQELRGLTRAALAEMRMLLLELRPTALVEAPLEDLLRQLAEAASGRVAIPIAVTVEGQAALPGAVKIALYRIIQEALNNAARHAKATRIALRLRCVPIQVDDPGRLPGLTVLLSVRDDGCGFDPTRILPGHLGLSIMEERARAIGASLSIDSDPREGTQVTVLWEGQVER
jgi:signal transduction histidine kinase